MASTQPRHILQLNVEEKRRFLNSFDHIFSDLDGVAWSMDYEVPHMAEGYEALRTAGKRLTFVTNNSVRPIDNCVKRFKKLNLEVEESQFWHPALTTVAYLRSIKFEGLIYIMATEPYKQLLREAGFQLIEGPNHFVKESIVDLAKIVFDRQPVRAVIIDMDFNITPTKLIRAQTYLRHPDCILLTGATDMILTVNKDITILGPGRFSQILIDGCKEKHTALGKPSKVLGEMLQQHYVITEPQRVLMIGDMLEQDFRFGRMCGYQTLIVLSGGCKLADLQAETQPDQLPDYYADSIADFEQLWRDVTQAHV